MNNYTPTPVSFSKVSNNGLSRGFFDFSKFAILPMDIRDEVEKVKLDLQRKDSKAPIPHNEILNKLLEQIEEINFRQKAGLNNDEEKLQRKHYIVCAVDEMLETARRNHWQLCQSNGQVFIYNGAFWKVIAREVLCNLFGEAAEKMGVPPIDARYFHTRRELIQQFEIRAFLPAPQRNTNTTLINLLNGTFEVSAEKQALRKPVPNDFLTYQLPFAFDLNAEAPLFHEYLDIVLPDKERQTILQEFLGYVFISPQTLKLEKVLLLFGGGANGKSVFIEVVNALLGRENVSAYSLQSLTDNKGYTRAELATRLLNTASEISGKMENEAFKQLASGEAIEARQIYGKPFTMEHYAKLLFSTNELPKDVEQTNGYYRRWLIVPFDVTIPDGQQDKELAQKIIKSELAGVFNWVLQGLQRLLIQRKFSESKAVTKQLEEFRKSSDSVLMFLEEHAYKKSISNYEYLKVVFSNYSKYCQESHFRPCSLKTFSERLRKAGFEFERKTAGTIIFIEN